MEERRFCPIISKDSPVECKKNCEFYERYEGTCILKNINRINSETLIEERKYFKRGFFIFLGFAAGAFFIGILLMFVFWGYIDSYMNLF